MKKFIKRFLMILTIFAGVCLFDQNVQAAEMSEQQEQEEESSLGFEIGTFRYEIIPKATENDMPPGFTLGDWEYHGNKIKAGFTENSDMVCVMAEDTESGYSYRFIYDPEHEMFVPYFGTEIDDGYIYTIPLYEGAEAPYGFEEGYYIIQTVPMFVFQREDAELTSEEIALGVLSEDAYLVFLMMNDRGEEVCYTYDLVDRTYQRSMLQERDAEKVAEINETVDKLHADISKLNAETTKRMNQRLTVIGVLAAAVLIMAGVLINLLSKISRMKKEMLEAEDDYDSFEGESHFRVKQDSENEDYFVEFEENEEIPEEAEEAAEEELEILDLDDLDE